MLVTDHFVFLNYPKTGSSFARRVIKEIYKQRFLNQTIFKRVLYRLCITAKPFIKELILPNIKVAGVIRAPDQHGTYSQIPAIYKDREIVSVVRNPYDRFLSTYEFRWWEKHPPISAELLAEHFPHFPNLSLDDYVKLNTLMMIHGRLQGKNIDISIGNQTVQFIQMFFINPQSVLAEITDEYIDSNTIFKDLAPITFLKQENLNEDLAGFLLRQGFLHEEVEFVRSHGKVNVTKGKVSDRNGLWTQRALNYVRYNERMIFKILKSKGIDYRMPQTGEQIAP